LTLVRHASAEQDADVRDFERPLSRKGHNEALDMARRTLHDEGAKELQTRLAGKVETDFDTARRLFTLICVLQMRG